MRAPSLTILAAVTAAAVAGAIATSALDRPPGAPERAGEIIYPGLRDALPGVAQVRIQTPLIDFTFAPDGDGPDAVWRVAERDGWPADMRKLAETLFALSDLTYVEPKTADPERHARLEIEDPDSEGARSRRIVVTGADGETLVDAVAGRRKFDVAAGGTTRGLYFRKAGDPQGWLAAGGLGVSDDAQGWLDSKLISLAPDRIARVSVDHRDGERVEIVRDGGGFSVTTLPAGVPPKSARAVSNVASALENLELVDVGRLSDFSFEGGAGGQARFETADGLAVTLDVLVESQSDTDAKPAHWALIRAHAAADADADVKDAAEALSAKTDGWVVKLPNWEATQVLVRNADLAGGDG